MWLQEPNLRVGDQKMLHFVIAMTQLAKIGLLEVSSLIFVSQATAYPSGAS